MKHESIVLQNSGLRRVQSVHSEMYGGKKEQKKANPGITTKL